MRVAVTGANGFVGGAACSALEAAGHQVTRVQRRRDPERGDGLDGGVLVWDLTEDAPEHAARVMPDVVVHVAGIPGTVDHVGAMRALHVGGTRRVLAAWPGVPVVHISTSAVYPARGEGPFAVGDATGHDLGDDYARTKWDAERAIVEDATATGRAAVVLRPSVIYGDGDRTFLPNVRKAEWAGRLWLPGAGRGVWSVTPVGLLADDIVNAAERLAAGQVAGVEFSNSVAPEPIALGELARRELSARSGRELGMVSVPVWLVWLAAATIEGGFRLIRPAATPMLTRSAATYVSRSRRLVPSRPYGE